MADLVALALLFYASLHMAEPDAYAHNYVRPPVAVQTYSVVWDDGAQWWKVERR